MAARYDLIVLRHNDGLVKTVELATARKVHYPFLLYCYLGIETRFQFLILHSKFYSHCQEWTSRTHTRTLEDI